MSYIPHTPQERKAMLEAIGVDSVDDLFTPLPSDLVLKEPMDLPPALSEIELVRHMETLARENRTDLVSFMGGGCYDHFIPAAVDHLAGRSEFYTAYTPYQPEISQGVLQAFFEYQSMICELTGLEVSNASMYDGATALAEALILCCGVQRKKKKVVVTGSIYPEYRQVSATYLRHFGVELVSVDLVDGHVDPDDVRAAAEGAAGVAIQSPNYLGLLEDGPALAEAAHDAGALCVAVCDPVSLGLLEPPGVQSMDVAVGDGQGLGCPVSFGGPAFGFFATVEKYVRSMPGRVVGATVDGEGRRGFVLTFQTREQHIRREKATSNICTNQGLMALRAAIHMGLLGPAGLREVASACAAKARETAEALASLPGFELLHDRPFFKEFPLLCPVDAEEVVETMVEEGFLAGVPLTRMGARRKDVLLVAVTEKRTSEEITAFAGAMKKRFGGAAR